MTKSSDTYRWNWHFWAQSGRQTRLRTKKVLKATNLLMEDAWKSWNSVISVILIFNNGRFIMIHEKHHVKTPMDQSSVDTDKKSAETFGRPCPRIRSWHGHRKKRNRGHWRGHGLSVTDMIKNKIADTDMIRTIRWHAYPPNSAMHLFHSLPNFMLLDDNQYLSIGIDGLWKKFICGLSPRIF